MSRCRKWAGWRHRDESYPNSMLRNDHDLSLSPQTYLRVTNRCARKQAWMTISPSHWISFICRMRCCDVFRCKSYHQELTTLIERARRRIARTAGDRGATMDFEIVCPNHHNQTVTFS